MMKASEAIPALFCMERGNAMRNARVLFFDVCGTLVDETRAWRQRCADQAQMAQAKGLGVTAQDVCRAMEAAARAGSPSYVSALSRCGLSERAPYRHELERPDPEAESVLRLLSTRYRLGIIANQAQGLEARLRASGILPWFSWVVSSAECGAAKPDPRIFLLAMERAGCVPEKAVMIGDRLDNDIAPAKALGMHTVWLRRGFGALSSPGNALETPDAQVTSLGGLTGLLL